MSTTPEGLVSKILTGIEYPSADEGGLQAQALAFRGLAVDLRALHERHEAQTAYVPGWHGPGYEAHRQAVNQVLGGQDGLLALAERSDAIASSVTTTAGATAKAKYQFWLTINWLIASVVWAIKCAFFTAGASLALLSAIEAAARAALGQIGQWLVRVITAAGMGAALVAGTDAAAQGLVIATGFADHFDVDSFLMSVASGALGGAVGLGVGALAGAAELTTFGTASLTMGLPGQILTQGVGGYTTQLVVSAAEGDLNTDWGGFVAGATGALAGHAVARHSLADHPVRNTHGLPDTAFESPKTLDVSGILHGVDDPLPAHEPAVAPTRDEWVASGGEPPRGIAEWAEAQTFPGPREAAVAGDGTAPPHEAALPANPAVPGPRAAEGGLPVDTAHAAEAAHAMVVGAERFSGVRSDLYRSAELVDEVPKRMAATPVHEATAFQSPAVAEFGTSRRIEEAPRAIRPHAYRPAADLPANTAGDAPPPRKGVSLHDGRLGQSVASGERQPAAAFESGAVGRSDAVPAGQPSVHASFSYPGPAVDGLSGTAGGHSDGPGIGVALSHEAVDTPHAAAPSGQDLASAAPGRGVPATEGAPAGSVSGPDNLSPRAGSPLSPGRGDGTGTGFEERGIGSLGEVGAQEKSGLALGPGYLNTPEVPLPPGSGPAVGAHGRSIAASWDAAPGRGTNGVRAVASSFEAPATAAGFFGSRHIQEVLDPLGTASVPSVEEFDQPLVYLPGRADDPQVRIAGPVSGGPAARAAAGDMDQPLRGLLSSRELMAEASRIVHHPPVIGTDQKSVQERRTQSAQLREVIEALESGGRRTAIDTAETLGIRRYTGLTGGSYPFHIKTNCMPVSSSYTVEHSDGSSEVIDGGKTTVTVTMPDSDEE
ncbi:hypothetical protein BX265_6871 [Streptomyces sp. TLI_235]|nr:hypothetical protein [Streptomyces sp. TLI_235]PBC69542.1 hypothetical protein BX265_6871 [Streptomyces sp. TLI_235]